jgi:protein-S-isoprenylcysteine O-methyltransferase Ste14
MPNITHALTGQIILGCWAVFIVVWIVAAFGAKRTVERMPMKEWRLSAAVIAVLVVALILLNKRVPILTGGPFLPYSTLRGLAADILAIAGLCIALWARATLGSNWSGNIVLKERHELIERGPYAYIRHPIYSGMILLELGVTLWFGSPGWVLLFVIIVMGATMKAMQEEKFLTKHFPEAYPEYKKRTKMFIPYVL